MKNEVDPWRQKSKKREGVTEDSEGEPGEDNPGNLLHAQEPLQMGETVEVHGKTWKRVEDLEEDTRTEPEFASKFSRLHYNESARETFWFRVQA